MKKSAFVFAFIAAFISPALASQEDGPQLDARSEAWARAEALLGPEAAARLRAHPPADLEAYLDRLLPPEPAITPGIPSLGAVAIETRTPDYEIVLRSRRFVPEVGVHSALPERSGGRHVILQCWDIPSEGAIGGGVELLRYLPRFAYQAWVPAGGFEALAGHPLVRSVVPFQPNDKISPPIRSRGVSEFLRNEDGTVRLLVLLFDDVDRLAGEDLLSEYGRVAGVSTRKNMVALDALESRIAELAGEDAVQWIEERHAEREMHLDQARGTVHVNEVQETPYDLDGNGVTVAIWDGGWVDINHDDFAGRLTIGDSGAATHYHSTHVGGIMAGSGFLSGGTLRGFATDADIRTYDWPDFDDINNLDDETSDAITHGAILSQNSWSLAVDAYPHDNCDIHGEYDAWSERYDEIVNGTLGDEILVICSSANEENDGDCGPYPWDQLNPPMATAKNPICVGAVYSDTQEHTCFSSRGPTDDGRLKPDLVAPGDEALDDPEPCLEGDMIRSTFPGDMYEELAGTSMSTPMVSGTVGLLRQQFDQLGYGEIKPHTYKAILTQTAEDLGNPGPDYTHGHGLLNTLAAVELVDRNYPNNELIRTSTVADDETDIYYMSVPEGVGTLRVTLAWDDLEGTPGAGTQLVNDLDLYLTSPSGPNYYAYRLDPGNPGDNATTGWNSRDNLEVVEVVDPEPGRWTVRVWGWIIPLGLEQYTVVMPYEDVQCGDVLYHDTVLAEDLDCSTNGLRLGADGICLDCADHAISGLIGTDNYGVYMNGVEKATVRNCDISGFARGLWMINADSCTIGAYNRFHDNTTGITLDPGSDGSVIGMNWVNDNTQRGIEMYTADYNTVGIWNDIYNNKRSIVIEDGSHHNHILGNGIHDNDFYGVLMGGPSTADNVVESNSIYGNNFGVRYWETGSGNAISENDIANNSYGVYIHGTSDHEVSENTIQTNTTSGVELTTGTADIRLENNTVCGNAVDIIDGAANTGDGNRCSLVTGWADDGQASGCDWQCGGCRQPEDDLEVAADMTLCAGTYALPDAGATGVITFGADNVALDGGGATLVGSDGGTGLLCSHDGVAVTNLNLQDYQFGIKFQNADGCTLSNATSRGNVANGVFLTGCGDLALSDCEVTGNGGYGLSIASTSYANVVGLSAVANGTGIYMTGATHVTVRDADLSENNYGIHLFNSTDNLVWDSRLFDNTTNAYEDASSNGNAWNDLVGNYWDDFADNAGYPYHYYIDGPGDGIDWRPVGAVIVVKPDGTGHYPTIQEAINAAADLNIIELTNGVFTGPGNRDLNYLGKAIWVRSASGDPDSCVIDCEGTPANMHFGVIFNSGETTSSILEGVTIRNGYVTVGAYGAGVLCLDSPGPLVRNCAFRDNEAMSGGAVSCIASSPRFEECIFRGNYAQNHGGAVQVREGSEPSFAYVTFVENDAAGLGGAMLIASGSQVQLQNCTFHENGAPSGGGIYIDGGSSYAEIVNTIIGSSAVGGAVVCNGGAAADLACCNVAGNLGGDWVGCLAGQLGVDGNISLDPLYCPDALTIQDDSPCAPYSPPNPECALIGAWPVDCTGLSAADEPALAPAEIFLAACRPNPAVAGARISYGISARAGETAVSLKVYDAAGHLVRTLVDGPQPQGYYTVSWRGDDERGLRVASGVYFYNLRLDGQRFSRRMIFLN